MILTPAEFAKTVGKNRTTVYKAIREQRLDTTEDGKIDTEAEKSLIFASKNLANNGGKYSTYQQNRTSHGDDTILDGDTGLDLSMRPEIELQRLLEQTRKLKLENDIKEGNYIPRKTVEDKIIAPVNEFLIRTISDLPRTTLLECKAMIKSDMPDGEAEKRIKSLYESNARRLKESLARAVKNEK